MDVLCDYVYLCDLHKHLITISVHLKQRRLFYSVYLQFCFQQFEC